MSSDLRTRAEHILHSGIALSDWEQAFLRNVANWSRLSPKQEIKLAGLEARANGEVADAKTAFLDAMEAAGIVPAEPISDLLGPDKIRFRCEGDRKGRKNGWAKFYDDGLPAGSFGSYKLGTSHNWRHEDSRTLSPAEREELERQQVEAKTRREAEKLSREEAAACLCDGIWGRASRQVDPSHGYLVRKGLAGEGLRQLDDVLLVPMHDASGSLWNLQRIWPDGRKLYVKNCRAERLILIIGEPRDRVVVAEGYATAAAIRRATGWPVVVAFCWQNLAFAAKLMRHRYPAADIVVAADDDTHLIDNPHVRSTIGPRTARAATCAGTAASAAASTRPWASSAPASITTRTADSK